MDQKLVDFLEKLGNENFNTYYQADIGKGKVKPLFTPTPAPLAQTHKWEYKKARAMLYELSEMLTPDQADRVNVQFENPGLKDYFPAATTQTMRGGIQLLKPGQIAPTHRHSANAFRFVLESEGSETYTIVDGTRIPMKKGDLILTPNWTWHDHRNNGNKDTIWFDGLDLIFSYWIGAIFYSTMGGKNQEIERDVEANVSVHGRNLNAPNLKSTNSRLLHYKFSDVQKALETMAAEQKEKDAFHVDYIDPRSGSDPIPTMNLGMRFIRPGKSGPKIRKTENLIALCFDGTGEIVFPEEGKSFSLESHDVVTIGAWKEYYFKNTGSKPLYVFTFSDAPIFRNAGQYKEQIS